RTAARDSPRKNENENQPGWAGRPCWKFPIRFRGAQHSRAPGFPPICILPESSVASLSRRTVHQAVILRHAACRRIPLFPALREEKFLAGFIPAAAGARNDPTN